jgi:two-component system heavy metal sensor histidine kinase CusS
LSFEPLDLARVVRECCLLFSDKAEGKGQKMTFDLAPGAWVLGDPSLLHRLIGVLVDNAIKYTPHGGGIHAFLRHAPSGSVLEIRDTGVGIANTDIPRIFDRRFRSQSGRDNEPGTGLGLNIARWIAEAHQASLSVQSTERIGSIFKVVFPPFADA